ncbi:TVP38/TMEM64 family protein [Gluconacetobacter azotocaptans]|uniref:TVP38/TMEM64 family protein n=1 Tax=Gluconacetobacter azotocaptans TaxID=142834 RepID=UPI001F050450|nr:VTT domain-containing protein [Gluconacetobacter azotocaptans]
MPYSDPRAGAVGRASPPNPPDASGRMRALARPALMVAAFMAVGTLLRFTPGLHGLMADTVLLRDGAWGRAVFLLVATLFCALGLPRQVVCFAAGVAYGPFAGVGFATAATVAGAVAGFSWARCVGRAAVRRWLSGRLGGRLARLDTLVAASPFATILTLRLLPVGSALMLNLLAGVSAAPARSFFLATLAGSLPQTIVFVLLGSGARIGHAWQVALAALLFAASAALGLWLMRRGGMTQGAARDMS